ncbi:MAG: major capsid protein [Desulfobacterales bacterium]|nr:major capsid protein [Desulfobacterales bacterium]
MFDLVSMTTGINLIPNDYGRLHQMGLFVDTPIYSDTLLIEEKHGVLNLLDIEPEGSPAPKGKEPKRKGRTFQIPNIPYDDILMAKAFANVRKFGTESETYNEAEVFAEKCKVMRLKHAITKEYLKWGALKGIVLSPKGKVVYNFFDEFEVTQKVIDFELDNPDTNIAKKCREVKRHIEQNMMGEVSNGKIHCFCDEKFFDDFIEHPNVEKYYLNHAQALNLVGKGGDSRKGFVFEGITFEEHSGNAPDARGVVRSFIEEGNAHFFPLGTRDTFKTYLAPASFLESVNTKGKELYAKQVEEKFGRWIDLHTQSNVLPMSRRPALLVKGETTVSSE